MLFAGFKVDDGTLTLFGIVAAGVLGNLVGSWIAYAIGYYGALELVERTDLPHEPPLPRLGRRWFKRHGDATVFFSRCCPSSGPSSRCPAGVARMPFWRFTWLTLAGCIPGCSRWRCIGKGWEQVG
jgi:membrane protein DedA with SNARE-associated domain